MLLANVSTPYGLLTLEPVRPGLTAKGSFKKNKSPELQRAIWSLSLVSLKPECPTSRKKNPFSPA